jgi:hypothetical protein
MYKIIGGDQKEYGPVSEQELRNWIGEGRLNAQSMIWVEGAAEWQPLSAFPEFAEALRLQAGSASPPVGRPMPPVNAEIWSSQILAQEPRVQPMECLALSWRLLSGNFGLLFGATFVVWLIGTVCGFVPFGAWVYWTLRGVLYGGLYLIFLKRIRGEATAVSEVFSGFNISFAQLVLAGMITNLISMMGFACCLVLPGLYLFVSWTFAVPLVADRRLEFWSAMELSRKVVSRVWFEMFGLLLLAFLPTILMFIFIEVKISLTMFSAMRDLLTTNRPDFSRIFAMGYQIAKSNLGLLLVSKLVLLLNLPFALGALMYAYENLFGTRTSRTA